MLLSFTNKAGQPITIWIDATTAENPTTTATVTESPIDGGLPTSDGVQPDLEEVSFQCVVTNAPITVPKSHMDGVSGTERNLEKTPFTTLQWDGVFNRKRAVYEELRTCVRDGLLVKAVTELRDYVNFRITELSPTIDVEDALKFSMTLRETVFATVEVVDAPIPAGNRERRRQSRGAQAPEPVTDPPPVTRSRLRAAQLSITGRS